MEAADRTGDGVVRTKDTGTLQYEIFFNADESEIAVLACPGQAARFIVFER